MGRWINNVTKSWLSQRIFCSFNYYWILLTYLTKITFSRPISFKYHLKNNHLELVFLFSLDKSRNRIARSCYSSIFRFLKNLYTVSHLAAPTCIPTNSMQVFPFVSAFYHKHNAFKVQLPLFSWDCACFRTSVPGKLGLLGILMSL